MSPILRNSSENTHTQTHTYVQRHCRQNMNCCTYQTTLRVEPMHICTHLPCLVWSQPVYLPPCWSPYKSAFENRLVNMQQSVQCDFVQQCVHCHWWVKHELCPSPVPWWPVWQWRWWSQWRASSASSVWATTANTRKRGQIRWIWMCSSSRQSFEFCNLLSVSLQMQMELVEVQITVWCVCCYFTFTAVWWRRRQRQERYQGTDIVYCKVRWNMYSTGICTYCTYSVSLS